MKFSFLACVALTAAVTAAAAVVDPRVDEALQTQSTVRAIVSFINKIDDDDDDKSVNLKDNADKTSSNRNLRGEDAIKSKENIINDKVDENTKILKLAEAKKEVLASLDETNAKLLHHSSKTATQSTLMLDLTKKSIETLAQNPNIEYITVVTEQEAGHFDLDAKEQNAFNDEIRRRRALEWLSVAPSTSESPTQTPAPQPPLLSPSPVFSPTAPTVFVGTVETLLDGMPTNPFDLETGGRIMFQLDPTQDGDFVSCTTTGNNGDADIAVKWDSIASAVDNDGVSDFGGSNESVTVAKSGSILYVLIYAYESFSGLVLECSSTSVETPAPPTPSPTIEPSMSSAPSTSSAPTGEMVWKLLSNSGGADQCFIVADRPNCIQCSPEDGVNYEDSVTCIFEVAANGQLSVEFWEVESCCDGFTLNDEFELRSTQDQVEGLVVSAGDTFTWSSDGWVSYEGWTICLDNDLTQSPLASSVPTSAPTAAIATLIEGVATNPFGLSRGGSRVFVLDPLETGSVTCITSDPYGFSLYLKWEEVPVPNQSIYDAVSFSMNISVATLGTTLYIMLDAYVSFTNLTLRCFSEPPITLTDGVATPNISLSRPNNGTALFVLEPLEEGEVICTTTGPNGDADLYVKWDQVATRDLNDGSSTLAGSNESIAIANGGTRLYVLVYAFGSFTNLTLQCTSYPPSAAPTQSPTTTAPSLQPSTSLAPTVTGGPSWKLISNSGSADQCLIMDDQPSCIQCSPEDGINYDDSVTCIFEAAKDGKLSVEFWEVESCCDGFRLNDGTLLLSTQDQVQGVVVSTGDTLTWSSDFSVAYEGWKVCLEEYQPTAAPTQSPTTTAPTLQPSTSLAPTVTEEPSWKLLSNSGSADQCLIMDDHPNCIQCSPEDGVNYEDDVTCSFEVAQNGELSVKFWEVESGYDGFQLNHGTLLSTQDQVEGIVVSSGDMFTWSSDGSVAYEGWTICLESPTTPIASPVFNPYPTYPPFTYFPTGPTFTNFPTGTQPIPPVPTDAPGVCNGPGCHPACFVCGEGKTIERPDVPLPDSTLTCGEVAMEGEEGSLEPDLCTLAQSFTPFLCGCMETSP